MAEYIEREAALNAINANKTSTELAWITVSKITAADVAPVVHGHWIRQDESFTRFKCSNPECGAENYGGFENYCPNCGAKMDEEKDSNKVGF